MASVTGPDIDPVYLVAQQKSLLGWSLLAGNECGSFMRGLTEGHLGMSFAPVEPIWGTYIINVRGVISPTLLSSQAGQDGGLKP